MTILDLLRRSAAGRATATAIHFENRHFTLTDLEGGSNAAARVLRSHGVRRGDRVVLYAGTSLEFVLAYLGTLKLGAIAVPANPAYRDTDLGWILENSAPRAILADRPGLARAARLAPACCAALLEVERGSGEPPGAGPKVFPFYQALRKSSVGPIDEIVDDDDLALVVYTSGTTGRAKGAVLTHGNLAANTRALLDAFAWTAGDRLVHALPLFHVHGLCVGLHGILATGCEAVLLPRFEAAEVLAELRTLRATLFMGVPTMYARLAEAAGAGPVDLPALRLLVCGSAPLPSGVAERCRALFQREILERYGMTETLITLAGRADRPIRRGSVGWPVAGAEVRVVDSDHRDVADGAAGELLVRGTSVGPCYWNDAAATEAARADGWFLTGDLAVRDPATGSFSVVGRARDVIISGGYNVYPREVEDALLTHPAVAECAVYGVADPDLGEAVAAAIVLAPGAAADAEALREHCRGSLASYKKPQHVAFVAELPRNAMGKIERQRLPAR